MARLRSARLQRNTELVKSLAVSVKQRRGIARLTLRQDGD